MSTCPPESVVTPRRRKEDAQDPSARFLVVLAVIIALLVIATCVGFVFTTVRANNQVDDIARLTRQNSFLLDITQRSRIDTAVSQCEQVRMLRAELTARKIVPPAHYSETCLQMAKRLVKPLPPLPH
jgi:hypothetical protein